MPYVHQVLATLVCVITFASCVQPLSNYTLWHKISAQQTFEHQRSEQQTSRHQTLQFDTFKHTSFEHVFWYHFVKHKTLGHQSLKKVNLGHQPYGNQKLEPKSLGDETSGQQSSRQKKSTGCTGPLLLPTKPFFVVWNHPTASCLAHGVDLGFDKWGIVDNNHDSFIGEEIVLFYQLGQIPRYSGKTPYYGGIPQLGNLSDHLQQVNLDIKDNIPSPAFSGLTVVDFEAWRPLFDLNFDSLKIYQQKSIELAKQKFPLYNQSQILQEATKEFEKAARAFLETTLQQASVVRPGGRWGYYGYPRCWDTYCNTSTVTINNRLSWIYNISTGLYPSIYFLRGESHASRATRIHNIIHETLRVKATWTSQDAVILPYSLCQDNSSDLFNETDLSFSIMEPADMGSSGVILWGSSNYMRAKNECLILQDYINTTLGPFVLNVTSFFGNCSQQLCEGHGRCVRTDYEQYYQHYLKKRGDSSCLIPDDVLGRKNTKLMTKANKSHANYIFRYHHEQPAHHPGTNASVLMVDQRELLSSDFDDYVCKCFAGWSGTHCEHPATE